MRKILSILIIMSLFMTSTISLAENNGIPQSENFEILSSMFNEENGELIETLTVKENGEINTLIKTTRLNGTIEVIIKNKFVTLYKFFGNVKLR